MSRLAFLSARAWLDPDGRHVWLRHDCTDGPETTMLPTIWKVNTDPSVGSLDLVFPSINCRGCGSHFFAQIEAKPEFEA